jgi:hypothetical protein
MVPFFIWKFSPLANQEENENTVASSHLRNGAVFL